MIVLVLTSIAATSQMSLHYYGTHSSLCRNRHRRLTGLVSVIITHPSYSDNLSRCGVVGFYVLDPSEKEQLILGPFMGKVACQTIQFRRGVCGKAARTAETQVVKVSWNHE